MKKNVLILLILFLTGILHAQIIEPVKWMFSEKALNSGYSELTFKATIDAGWHLYGTFLPDGGPKATVFHFNKMTNVESAGEIIPQSHLVEEYDKTFDMNLNWYVNEAVFTKKIKVKEGYFVGGCVEFMACNDSICLSPSKAEFSFGTPIESENNISAESVSITADNSYWRPVIEELQAFGDATEVNGKQAWWLIFIKGFIGGLLALLTPCVWPIIPMTISFFLKRSDNKRKGRSDAILYGLSIIFIYLFLGIIITLLFGASALNSLSTNAFFNLFFFALLLLFAISFFGAFDISLPSSWSTKLDKKAEKTTGILSILLMAFTLVLVSFSCTGPIIGTLLVEVSVNGSIFSPFIGMIGFAVALAMPFSLFALFPVWLKSMPKSGGWLNSVKVTLGFLELALSLKFLSVADLAYGWRILDREVFIALWVVIFAMLGFYLMGKIKFSHDSDLPHVSVIRLFLGLISLAFAVYLVPGLWGAPLKSVSAFAPPLYTQDFNLYDNEVHASFDDYETGMRYAEQKKMPVLIDFSGYGCVNCRKMESSVWTDAEVSDLLRNKFVLITLFVDDKTKLDKPIYIEENGVSRTLKTIGDKNSYLQRVKFGSNAQPFYVALNTQGFPLEKAYVFDENPANFTRFLKNSLNNFSK